MSMGNMILIPGPVKTSHIAEYFNKTSDDKSAGAHSVFLGQVRSDMVDDRTVRAIEYSAYEEMVAKETLRIKEIIMTAFSDVKDVVIVHSTGIVKAGELSLFVMVTAGHRDHATRACRHVLEMIKENFPVWKKEIFDDDTHQWQH
ncbi:MAG TPA: molybdenum cofactor biosynthesis protein MoaE [Bacteroidetes bacterium]|nr:molybdenum cofactor biosynthesis protein MoaE [Bacteroidota bacterium]